MYEIHEFALLPLGAVFGVENPISLVLSRVLVVTLHLIFSLRCVLEPSLKRLARLVRAAYTPQLTR